MANITWFDVDKFIDVLKEKGMYVRRYQHAFRITIVVHGKFALDMISEDCGAHSTHEGYMCISFSEFEGGRIGIEVYSCDYYNNRCIKDDKMNMYISGVQKKLAAMDTIFSILDVVIDNKRLTISLQK